jgi:N-acetylneuraminic acid mutarotase
MTTHTTQQWAKVGRKHYRHESGAEVTYDYNRFLWIANGFGYTTLHAAQSAAVRKAGA